ncbi:hypothetical protein AVEN_60202-1 [Araneus ventricosus]|uniref:Uncharacterized protein n=1 Tax=Araneus ventricosus TaxID=182803 RepID=A0A4Y2CMS0_ARAVE|nr:hypothetical protein AVEN_60202-1 [Araneus ventricosus]
MRSTKQTERQLLLMESSLAYTRGKEENSKKLKGRQKRKEKKTLGNLGVVNPVTSREGILSQDIHLCFYDEPMSWYGTTALVLHCVLFLALSATSFPQSPT